MEYLPVFLNLRDRLTLVVGAGAVAARKIDLLLKAQARVRVVAPTLNADVASLRDAGRIQYIAAPFAPEYFSDVAFAIAATDSTAVNQAVANAGAARGVFVNVVDETESSTAIMPAIVDRSPIVVAIGTSALSPTLARRLRAQLEAMLPERLSDLARWSGEVRERVSRALPDLNRRRRFWDQLFAGNIASAVLAGRRREADTMLDEQLRDAGGSGAVTGEVYLIGAGPGDPDLLTLRALQLLSQADVVLYDRLVSRAVLERVRRDAECVFVGKETGEPAQQQRINELLVQLARAGKRVARLKGGDPFVFGRGGEELEVLAAHEIPCIVVPGITAALGAAASASLPLTHRRLAHSVTFVSGHQAHESDSDWGFFADPRHTVVFYMGVAQLPAIVQRLRAAGAAVTHPMALIEQATLPQERVVRGRLGDIVALAAQHRIGPPALLITGDAAAFAPGEPLNGLRREDDATARAGV